MSVIGFIQWRKASEAVGEGEIHLARISRTVAVWSTVLFVLGSLVLMQVLKAAGDPAPQLDAIAVTLRHCHLVAGPELSAAVDALDCGRYFHHHHLPHHGPVLDGCFIHGVYCQRNLWVFPLEKKGEIPIFE